MAGRRTRRLVRPTCGAGSVKNSLPSAFTATAYQVRGTPDQSGLSPKGRGPGRDKAMYRTQTVASLIVLVATLMAAAPAFASDTGEYASGAGVKLGRGLINTATGWGEIPKQTIIGSQEDGVLGGIGGFFKGIGLGVARTLVGAFEIATFWAPVPERFEPVMQPSTVFEMGTDRALAKAGSEDTSK